jgi:streptogramin lyase
MVNRDGVRLRRALAGVAAALVLAACGGGGGGGGVSAPLPVAPPSGGGGTNVQHVGLRMVIRGPHRARHGIHPKFVSPSTNGVLGQAYPHGAARTPANLIAQSAVDVSSGSAACGGKTGFPRSCTVTIGVPPTGATLDDFVFTSYDAAPVGATFPAGAQVLGIGTVLNQAIVVNTNNVLTIYLDGVIAGLSGQPGFASLPADGSAHVLSFVIDPSDYGDNPIVAGSNDPYANPIVVSLVEAGGTGHSSLSLDGGPPAASVTLSHSTDTATLHYDGGGAPGYGAGVTIAAPSVGGIGGASEAVQVSPMFVSSVSSSYVPATRTLNLSTTLRTTMTISELKGPGVSMYTATPGGSCANVATAAPATGTRASATVAVTGGTVASTGGCTIAFSDGTSTVDVTATNTTGTGGIGVPPAVTIAEFPIPTRSSLPSGIAAGSDGALWFTECASAANKIGRIPTGATPGSGAQITEFPVPAPHSGPVGITAGPDGALWFGETQTGLVGTIPTSATPGSGAQIQEFPSFSNGPLGIATGADGNLWYGDTFGNDVESMTPAGLVVSSFLTTNFLTNFVAGGPDGAMWFTECAPTGTIGRIASAQLSEAPVPTTLGTTPAPFGIAAGPDGNMWFTDPGTNAIGKAIVTGSGIGAIEEIAIPGGGEPIAITAGPDGAMWFTLAGATSLIGRIPTNATSSADIAEYSTPTANADPVAITQGPDGMLWFVEFSPAANKIARLAIGSSPSAQHAIRNRAHVRPAFHAMQRGAPRRRHLPWWPVATR